MSHTIRTLSIIKPDATKRNITGSINSYIENLEESDKKELMEIINEDTKSLKIKFETLKKDAAIKLNDLIEKENDSDVKSKITETVDRIKNEKFDQVTYFKLKQLVESL